MLRDFSIFEADLHKDIKCFEGRKKIMEIFDCVISVFVTLRCFFQISRGLNTVVDNYSKEGTRSVIVIHGRHAGFYVHLCVHGNSVGSFSVEFQISRTAVKHPSWISGIINRLTLHRKHEMINGDGVQRWRSSPKSSLTHFSLCSSLSVGVRGGRRWSRKCSHRLPAVIIAEGPTTRNEVLCRICVWWNQSLGRRQQPNHRKGADIVNVSLASLIDIESASAHGLMATLPEHGENTDALSIALIRTFLFILKEESLQNMMITEHSDSEENNDCPYHINSSGSYHNNRRDQYCFWWLRSFHETNASMNTEPFSILDNISCFDLFPCKQFPS